ncbi:MAG TPA: hypothetical protein V6D19_20590 [Stenomitos sp.]
MLLKLHKALMDIEHNAYEQNYGPIVSKGEYFRLLLNHEWFSWLRPISQMIVRIDEVLAAKPEQETESPEGLLAEVGNLLHPSEEGCHAERRYYWAIQHSSDIALMHGNITQLLPETQHS